MQKLVEARILRQVGEAVYNRWFVADQILRVIEAPAAVGEL